MAFFNILHFVVIYLGITALVRLLGDRASFKQSIKMGVWISLVYGITAALGFVVILMVVGTKWMAGEPGAQQLPMKVVALQAFAGLFIARDAVRVDLFNCHRFRTRQTLTQRDLELERLRH